MTLNINWQAIDLVMFDMDGTLLDLSFDNLFWLHAVPQAWAKQHNHSLEHAHTQLKPQFRSQEGTLNWYSLPYWSNSLGIDLTELKINHQHHISLRPHALEILTQLKQAGKKIWLVTNAHPIVLDIKMRQTGIAHFFEHLISSHDLGFAKEQELFWHKLQAQYPFERTRSLFIDDSEPVLNAAYHYGIGHLFSIVQPDSQQPKRQQLKYPAIDQLNDLSTPSLMTAVNSDLQSPNTGVLLENS